MPQVKISARMRSKEAKEALSGQVETAMTDLAGKLARVDGGSGRLKMPKKKKVLTQEQETEKQVMAAKKKSLACAFRCLHCNRAASTEPTYT